jgi:hypothetical protein
MAKMQTTRIEQMRLVLCFRYSGGICSFQCGDDLRFAVFSLTHLPPPSAQNRIPSWASFFGGEITMAEVSELPPLTIIRAPANMPAVMAEPSTTRLFISDSGQRRVRPKAQLGMIQMRS